MRVSFCHTNQQFDPGFTREVAAVGTTRDLSNKLQYPVNVVSELGFK